MRILAVVVTACISLLGRGAKAQAMQDGSELSRAAARYVSATLLPKEVIGLDTVHVRRGARADPQGVARAADAIAIARELGDAKLGTADDFVRCTNGARSCEFVGVDAVVMIDPPVIRGETGFVRVRIQEKTTSARRPVLVTDGVVRFARRSGVWVFVAYDNHSIS